MMLGIAVETTVCSSDATAIDSSKATVTIARPVGESPSPSPELVMTPSLLPRSPLRTRDRAADGGIVREPPSGPSGSHPGDAPGAQSS